MDRLEFIIGGVVRFAFARPSDGFERDAVTTVCTTDMIVELENLSGKENTVVLDGDAGAGVVVGIDILSDVILDPEPKAAVESK